MASSTSRRFWRYVRDLTPPLLLWTLFAGILVDTIRSRLRGDEAYDEAALREWIEESRVFHLTLPEMVREYLEMADPEKGQPDSLPKRAAEIKEQLKSLGRPTKMYQGQLPLFPAIYRLELDFPAGKGAPLPPIVWESKIPRPRQSAQVRRLEHPILGAQDHRARLRFEYQLHAYNKRQRDEQISNLRLRWVSVLAAAATLLAVLWIYFVQHREREREQQRLVAQQQIDQAERLLLEKELRRQEAERNQEEAERKLLEQQLATQAAERSTLEMKSQLYASVGIMAGSYAHNIKNLLVRPNDLLRRCLEGNSLTRDQDYMIREVRQTLGTVTERLQQILQTVRRDPSRSDIIRLDFAELVRDIGRTWEELALEKWKLKLITEVGNESLGIQGDYSHLQQAIENLLFNARDATYEMRNHLREAARRSSDIKEVERRQGLIEAAGWKGSVTLRAFRKNDNAILEVQDNGIGMTEQVKWRCTETHFSTKRNNAVYEGNTTGMGLGLSFVAVILEHHGGQLQIESKPFQGALFRLTFPLVHSASDSAPQ